MVIGDVIEANTQTQLSEDAKHRATRNTQIVNPKSKTLADSCLQKIRGSLGVFRGSFLQLLVAEIRCSVRGCFPSCVSSPVGLFEIHIHKCNKKYCSENKTRCVDQRVNVEILFSFIASCDSASIFSRL